jgi:hypothetical protein
MALEHKGKRAKPRKYISVPLAYTYLGLEAVNYKRYFSGKTYDISDSGVSFYTTKPLLDGVDIEIFCKGLWDEKRTGIVRWCKTLTYNYYIAGVDLQ